MGCGSGSRVLRPRGGLGSGGHRAACSRPAGHAGAGASGRADSGRPFRACMTCSALRGRAGWCRRARAVHRAASGRLITWYLRTADRADRLLIPGRRPSGVPAARIGPGGGGTRLRQLRGGHAWCDPSGRTWSRPPGRPPHRERTSSLRTCRGTRVPHEVRRTLGRLVDIIETGLDAPDSRASRSHEIWQLSSLGAANGDLRRIGDAERYLRQALVSRRTRRPRGRSRLVNLGFPGQEGGGFRGVSHVFRARPGPLRGNRRALRPGDGAEQPGGGLPGARAAGGSTEPPPSSSTCSGTPATGATTPSSCSAWPA